MNSYRILSPPCILRADHTHLFALYRWGTYCHRGLQRHNSTVLRRWFCSQCAWGSRVLTCCWRICVPPVGLWSLPRACKASQPHLLLKWEHKEETQDQQRQLQLYGFLMFTLSHRPLVLNKNMNRQQSGCKELKRLKTQPDCWSSYTKHQ